nr:CHASE3 domain-containing protein [uncultured Psychroserpens sp.]
MKNTVTYNYRFLKLAFGLDLFIILCIGGFSYKHTQDLKKSVELTKHTYEVNIELKDLLTNIKKTEISERDFIISDDSSFIDNYNRGRIKIAENLKNLDVLTQDNALQQTNLDSLNKAIGQRLFYLSETLEDYKSGNLNSPGFKSSFELGNLKMSSIEKEVEIMMSHEDNILYERKKQSEKALSRTPIILYSVLILTLLLLLVAYAIINRDLKAFKHTNEKLNMFKESASLSEIVSRHGSWTCHIDDETYEFSDNLYRILGEEPQSFESTIENFMTFVHKEDVEKLTAQVERMVVEQNLPFIYYRIIRKDGEIRHLKAYGEAYTNDDGENKLIGTTADITDEVHNFQIIEERNEELERNNKELSAFNYVASHDLQEPLRKIQTFISRLDDKESKNLSEKGKMYMDRIRKAADRMRLLIDDLLQFSRTNRADSVAELTDINIILEEAKQENLEVIVEKKATITYDEFPEIAVIPFQIKQLFINLLGNALKYSKEDVTPHINITYEKVAAKKDVNLHYMPENFYHKISIKDNGIGFEQEYAKKIFTLFNRLHSRDEYSGTGIGLSICKKIMDNHNGLIIAHGKPNEGSTFTVYIPEQLS